jgi:ribosomal protein S18 acetylase RimI-like enzyme
MAVVFFCPQTADAFSRRARPAAWYNAGEVTLGAQMTIFVTPMKLSYFRSFHRAFDAIAREGRYFVRPGGPDRGALRRSTKDALARRHPFFVALDGRDVIGWIHIAFPELPMLAHSGTLVMGLLPEYRRQGIGTRLLHAAMDSAFENPERRRVQLEVMSDNQAAIALYAEHGFAVEGVAERAVRRNGELVDIVHMALFR